MFEEVEVNSERWLLLENLKNEVWKDIKGYEGLYQVSNYGRVKSLGKYVNSGLTNVNKIFLKERIKKLSKTKKGYLEVKLSKKCKGNMLKVHRLVAISFIENKNNYSQINHKDEVKTNNCVNNLEWCNCQYNSNYGSRNERIRKTMGTKICKYNEEGSLLKEWNSMKQASCEERISLKILSECCKGIRKNYKGYIWRYKK